MRIYVCLILLLAACSPNKKMVLTMSERMTNRWKGATETNVVNGVGSYQSKVNTQDGYKLRFDYSYDMVSKLEKELPLRTTATVGSRDSKGNPVLVPKNNPAPVVNNQRYNTQRIVKYMDFYFDAAQRVQQVVAEGYPDSVYYVKRK